MTVRMINSRYQLLRLQGELGVRSDWHEPDEQDVSARVYGAKFDNAGFWGPNVSPYTECAELHVVLYHEGEAVAAVNLATLFAWATGHESGEPKPAVAPVPTGEMPDGYRVIRIMDGRVMSRVMGLSEANRFVNTMNDSSQSRGRGRMYKLAPYFRVTETTDGEIAL